MPNSSNYDLKITIGAELGQLRKVMSEMGADLRKMSGQAEAAGQKAGRGMNVMEKGIASAKRQLLGLATAWASIASIKGFVRIADEYKQIQSRLKLVTDGAEAFQYAQERSFEIAQATRTEYSETARLFTTIKRSTKELNLSDMQRLRIVETINKAIKVSGAGSEAAKAALVQLGQGLQAGTLRGEELNSVLEQAPRIAELIAAGMGISTTKLKEYGEQGKFSAEAVTKALLTQSDVIDKEFAQIPATVSGALTTINNAWKRYIGEVDAAAGATQDISQMLLWAGENLTKIIELVLRTGAVIVGVFLYKGVAALTAFTASLNLSTAATYRLATAMGVLQKSAAVLLAAFAGWQVGTWLREQFVEVERYGISVARNLTIAWLEVVAFFKKAGAVIGYAMTAPLEAIQERLAGLLSYMAEVADHIPGIGNRIRDGLKVAAALVRPMTSAAAEFRKEIGEINAELDAERKRAVEIYRKLFINAGKAKAQAGAKPPPTPDPTAGSGALAKAAVANATAIAKAEIDAALKELDRLREQNLIGFQDYFKKRTALLQESIDAEIAAKKEALATEDKTDKRSKILTDIILLEKQRGEVAVEAAYKQQLAEEALADKLEQVRIRLLELEGKTGEARAARVEARYADTIAKLQANGDQAGVDLMNKLVNIEQARANLEQIKTEFGNVVSDMQADQQSIQAQEDVGTKTPLQAEADLIRLRETTLEQLEALRERTAALYETTKDPEVARTLQAITTRIDEMRVSSNQYFDAIKASLQGNLKTALIEISDDTDNVKDAFKNMAESVIKNIRDMAAEALANQVIKSLFSAGAAAAGGGSPGLLTSFLQLFASSKHSGGMAGTGPRKAYPAWLFAGAPRLHNGGYLKPGEVPTVLQTGEEVLARNDPRNVANGGGQPDQVKIINVVDRDEIGDYMASVDGQKTQINTLRLNSGTAQQVLI